MGQSTKQKLNSDRKSFSSERQYLLTTITLYVVYVYRVWDGLIFLIVSNRPPMDSLERKVAMKKFIDTGGGWVGSL